METIQQSLSPVHAAATASGRPTMVHRFFDWCKMQEKNKLGWVAAILTAHGCVITPLTLCVVALTGNNFIFWPFIIGAIGMCLITNLAAMPTKVTIPVFFISLLIDLAIIGNSIGMAVFAD